MNIIQSEKEYQAFILDYLNKQNGYVVRKNANFDRFNAMDKELLFKFLYDTQPKQMETLRKIYKSDLENTLINYINSEITKKKSSCIYGCI